MTNRPPSAGVEAVNSWSSLTFTGKLRLDHLRTLLVNKLLESLNPTKKEVDELWAKEAEKRVEDIGAGKVKTILGEKGFKEIRDKFNLW